LAHDRRLERWARSEPCLRRLRAIDDLRTHDGSRPDPTRFDLLLGALVRTGSADGGDDPDAVLVVLHLLEGAVQRLARELADLSDDPFALVVGELAMQVRAAGRSGRRGGRIERCFERTLLVRTRRALLRELRPHVTAKRRGDADIPVDPLNAAWMERVFGQRVPGPGSAVDVDLAELLGWAERTGICDPADLQLLLPAEQSRERRRGAPSQCRVAAQLGIHEATLRRRRDRALLALRAARCDYLRWVNAA
jgi:hypothetical protein